MLGTASTYIIGLGMLLLQVYYAGIRGHTENECWSKGVYRGLAMASTSAVAIEVG